MMDRIGRGMIDLAPHLAMMGKELGDQFIRDSNSMDTMYGSI